MRKKKPPRRMSIEQLEYRQMLAGPDEPIDPGFDTRDHRSRDKRSVQVDGQRDDRGQPRRTREDRGHGHDRRTKAHHNRSGDASAARSRERQSERPSAAFVDTSRPSTLSRPSVDLGAVDTAGEQQQVFRTVAPTALDDQGSSANTNSVVLLGTQNASRSQRSSANGDLLSSRATPEGESSASIVVRSETSVSDEINQNRSNETRKSVDEDNANQSGVAADKAEVIDAGGVSVEESQNPIIVEASETLKRDAAVDSGSLQAEGRDAEKWSDSFGNTDVQSDGPNVRLRNMAGGGPGYFLLDSELPEDAFFQAEFHGGGIRFDALKCDVGFEDSMNLLAPEVHPIEDQIRDRMLLAIADEWEVIDSDTVERGSPISAAGLAFAVGAGIYGIVNRRARQREADRLLPSNGDTSL